jgi:hypothetical protein
MCHAAKALGGEAQVVDVARLLAIVLILFFITRAR